MISFHTYETICICSEHLALSPGATTCPYCDLITVGMTVGRISQKRQLVHKKLPFEIFFRDYYLKRLLKFKKHRFLFTILSNNHTAGNCQQIIPTQIWSQQDFAERLTLQFNKQAQHEYFGGVEDLYIVNV